MTYEKMATEEPTIVNVSEPSPYVEHCYVCMESDGKLRTPPCLCKGSLKIHEACLAQIQESMPICKNCNTKFRPSLKQKTKELLYKYKWWIVFTIYWILGSLGLANVLYTFNPDNFNNKYGGMIFISIILPPLTIGVLRVLYIVFGVIFWQCYYPFNTSRPSVQPLPHIQPSVADLHMLADHSAQSPPSQTMLHPA